MYILTFPSLDLPDPKPESLEQPLAAKKPPTGTGRNSKGNSGGKGFPLTAGSSGIFSYINPLSLIN